MRRLVILMGVSLVLSGCLYSHTVVPLMTDFASTPASGERSSGEIKTLTYYVSVAWDKNGIGDIARRYGIEKIYYADIETTRVLWYWQQQRVHIYGR